MIDRKAKKVSKRSFVRSIDSYLSLSCFHERAYVNSLTHSRAIVNCYFCIAVISHMTYRDIRDASGHIIGKHLALDTAKLGYEVLIKLGQLVIGAADHNILV